MGSFILLFAIITGVTLAFSLLLFLLRRRRAESATGQEHISPSVFEFYTTLYAFFIGFAIVTLWTAHLNAKANAIREANSLLTAYRIAVHLPGTDAWRQALAGYVKSVIEDEWPQLQQGSMSPETERRFEDLWSQFYQLKTDQPRESDLHASLSQAGQQRMSRAIILQGNLYPPVWVILIFGFISVCYGLFFIKRQPNVVSLIYEFMVIFLMLACIYFIYDLDTPFSGFIVVEPEMFTTVYAKILALH
jgi:hypothetical protein